MFEGAKWLLLWVAKVPSEPLDPMGDVHSLRVFRAAPGYLRYLTLGWCVAQLVLLTGGLIVLLPILVGSVAAGAVPAVVLGLAWLALLGFLGQAVVTYFSLRLNYEMRWYKVTDRSLRIRTGVWNVHEMTVTFANIQNITITQGPLERLFGISDVRVETAGGGGGGGQGKGEGLGVNLHVGIFRGVESPDEIRHLILARLRRVRDTGLGDVNDARGVGGTPAREGGFGADADTLKVLAAFRDEARALRRVAETALRS